MTSDRPYRDAFSWEAAAEEIVSEAGRQFDPSVVEAFESIEPKLHRIHLEMAA